MMIEKIRLSNKAQKLYAVWITSILLGFYAYQQPLNCLLDKIRQAGIISISLGSVKENYHTVLQAIIPTLLIWLMALIVWSILFWLGMNRGKKYAELLFDWLAENERYVEILFYVGMWIEMVWASLYYATFHMPFATILVFIAMQCFAFRIVLTEHSRTEWLWIIILLTIGVACELYTTRGFVLRAVLLIVASKGIDLKKVMKYYLVVNVVACIIIIAASAFGIAGTWIEVDAYRAIDEVQNRYIWGFNSPNTTHYALIRLALVAMYIWWDRLRLWHVAGIFIINYVLYMLTDSRTGFMVGAVSCILAVFFLYLKKMREWKIWYYLAMVLIVGLAAFSLHFLHWNFYEYDTLHTCPMYVYRINDMLVGRIHQALKFTQNIEISPIGTRQSGVYCDMGYIKFFLQEGFLIYFIYIWAVCKLLLWQRETKDYAGYIIVVVISLRMFMESSFVPFVFQNILLLLLLGNWNKLITPLKERG